MADLGFGIGVALAILGPLLLIPVVWGIHRFVMLPLVRSRLAAWPILSRWIALAASILLVFGIMAASYLPGRGEFDRLCAVHGVAVVSDRVHVDGFYRAPLPASEARRWLAEGDFDFVEGRHPYRNGVLVRYMLGEDGKLGQTEIEATRSRYAVRQEFVEHLLGTRRTTKVIYEVESGSELARAATLVYGGGPLSLFLGVHGLSSCPDVRTPEGAKHFATFYELERRVLGAAGEGPQGSHASR